MSATKAQVDVAIVILKQMINAAENGNQAGEDAVVAAAHGPTLLVQLIDMVDFAEALARSRYSEYEGDPSLTFNAARAAIARATGAV